MQRSEALIEFCTEHDKAGDGHRIHHDASCDGRWRNVETFHLAAQRHRQRGDIE
jgi:hypothetical protein